MCRQRLNVYENNGVWNRGIIVGHRSGVECGLQPQPWRRRYGNQQRQRTVVYTCQPQENTVSSVYTAAYTSLRY